MEGFRIKAASLYETLKIQHPSFNILIIIIIIITSTSIAPFPLLSNGTLQQQLLPLKKLIKWTNNSALYKNFKIKLSHALKITILLKQIKINNNHE